MTRSPLTLCTKCHHRGRLLVDRDGYFLRGRLVKTPAGIAWLCQVCIGSLPWRLKRAFYGVRPHESA